MTKIDFSKPVGHVDNAVKPVIEDASKILSDVMDAFKDAKDLNVEGVLKDLSDMVSSVPTLIGHVADVFKVCEETIKDFGKIKDSKEVQDATKNMSEAFNKTFDTLKTDATSIINDIGKGDLSKDLQKLLTDFQNNSEDLKTKSDMTIKTVNEAINQSKEASSNKNEAANKENSNDPMTPELKKAATAVLKNGGVKNNKETKNPSALANKQGASQKGQAM